MRRRRFLLVTVLAVIAVFFAWRLYRPPALYRVTILPSPGDEYRAAALNDLGQVVGTAFVEEGGLHLFLWDRENGMQDLGPVDVIQERPMINNVGQVCGTISVDDSEGQQAFLWESGKGRTVLGTLGGDRINLRAMNNRGQIIGVCFDNSDPSGSSRYFIWDKALGMRELKTPDGRPCCGEGISDAGQILISADDDYGHHLWFILDPNTPTLLSEIEEGAAPCRLNSGLCVAGIGVNDASEVCVALMDKQRMWEYLLPITGPMIVGFNDGNQIACRGFKDGFWERWRGSLLPHRSEFEGVMSYLWDPTRGRILLNRYIHGERWFIVEDLNNKGSMIGTAKMKDGTTRSFLLEPIPERWR